MQRFPLPPWRTWPRRWRILVVSLAGLYAAYLLVANLCLNSGLFERMVNRQPARFSLAIGPALSLWPGQVLAWDVRVRGQVRRVVWTVQARRAGTRVALWPLLRRELHLPRIRARGMSAEVHTVATGLAPATAGGPGWTVRLPAIIGDDIEHLRLGELLLEGRGHGRVGLVKQLRGGPFELLPSELAFSQARLAWGRTDLLEQGELRIDAALPRHDPHQVPGLAKLGLLQARLRLHGLGTALRVDSGRDQVDLRGVPSAARVYADLRLQQGALAPGSRLLWRTPLLAGVGAPDRGVLTVQLDAARDLRLQARLPTDPRTGSRVDVDLDVAGRTLPFADPLALLPRTSGRAQLRWRFESLCWIGALFVDRPWFALAGTGLVDADLQLRRGRLQPGSRLDVPSVRARADVAGMHIDGQAHARGRLVGDERRPRMRLDVDMDDFSARTPERRLLVRGRGLRLQLEASGELAHLRQDLRARLQLERAGVPDLQVYNRYLPRDSVRLLAGGGQLSADLWLDGGGQVGHGQARLQASQAQVQFAGLRLAGELDLQAHLARAELARGHYRLDGSRLALRGISVSGEDAPAPGWWATVDFPTGQVQAGEDFQVDAQADIGMRDASVLLALFSRRSRYPRWIGRVLDAGRLQAAGQLRWRRDRLWVDRLQAHNDRFDLRARLDLSQTRQRGQLYARWGVLGVGVAMDGNERDWHLFGARRWYEGLPPLLPVPAAKAVPSPQ